MNDTVVKNGKEELQIELGFLLDDKIGYVEHFPGCDSMERFCALLRLGVDRRTVLVLDV